MLKLGIRHWCQSRLYVDNHSMYFSLYTTSNQPLLSQNLTEFLLVCRIGVRFCGSLSSDRVKAET
jgi:hypothetical protein